MQLIKAIEIRYLRSIHRLKVPSTGNLTIFSGANDVGKSNILKALNLFFNNHVDWEEIIDFYQDFSYRRMAEVRRNSIKGRQFIRIDLTFNRPNNYKKSLPEVFTVTRIWFRDSIFPQETNNLESLNRKNKIPGSLETARRMLSQFLNRVRFEYVPAIRDREFFQYVLENLQESLIATRMRDDDPLLTAVKDLNEELKVRAESLRSDFEKTTEIETDVSLPTDPSSLFRAFSVSTKWLDSHGEENIESQPLSLSLRGDGIQALYIPSLLNYIAENSPFFHIWGFEEPENSVEFNRATDLANEFTTVYCKKAQIFVTSHSPAFVTLKKPNIVSYRIYKSGNTTELAKLHPSPDSMVLDQLSEDIGLFRIQELLYEDYLEHRQNAQRMERDIRKLQDILNGSATPVVYVEGKNDVKILKTAWEKLFPNQHMNFNLKSCDPLPDGADGGAGGAVTLNRFLSTVRSDSPHIAIGIFDHDKAGKKAFESLPDYFLNVRGLNGVKRSRSKTAVALLLPVPDGKEEYAEISNLYIEFFFSEEALTRQNEGGQGLIIEQPEIEKRVCLQGGPVIEKTRSTLAYTRQIKEGKSVFADDIIPNLDSHEFENFRIIFDKIESILALPI